MLKLLNRILRTFNYSLRLAFMEAIAYEKIEQLVGRAYQEELAQYARERNVIIAADTGTGKTLVSAMVIRWKIAMERINSTDIRKARGLFGPFSDSDCFVR